jgi:uncharacterized protein (DUF4415 family)
MTDWLRVRAMRDEDIAHDEDSPRTTEADWEGAVMRVGGRSIGTVRLRGSQKAPLKVSTTLRLPPEVLAYFKAGGPGWQTRIGEALKEWIKAHPLG